MVPNRGRPTQKMAANPGKIQPMTDIPWPPALLGSAFLNHPGNTDMQATPAAPGPSIAPLRQAGVTLVELMVGLLIAAVIVFAAVPGMNRMIERHRTDAAVNSVLGLMTLARGEAMTGGPVLLCDALRGCDDFAITNQLLLARADPEPPHERPLANQPPLARLTLPEGTSLQWRRFRGEALRFQRSGILHYQNGHFLVCNGQAARKIIMSWSGRARVEPVPPGERCDEPGQRPGSSS